jgi:hypothetical protein
VDIRQHQEHRDDRGSQAAPSASTPAGYHDRIARLQDVSGHPSSGRYAIRDGRPTSRHPPRRQATGAAVIGGPLGSPCRPPLESNGPANDGRSLSAAVRRSGNLPGREAGASGNHRRLRAAKLPDGIRAAAWMSSAKAGARRGRVRIGPASLWCSMMLTSAEAEDFPRHG